MNELPNQAPDDFPKATILNGRWQPEPAISISITDSLLLPCHRKLGFFL
jgi:hypothetical protein